MPPPTPPEVWLRGPIADVPWELMPVVHSLLQVGEELAALTLTFPSEKLWERPGGAGSVGFHVLHLAASLDRLLTYARGEALNERQRMALEGEESPDRRETAAELFAAAQQTIERAIAQVRATPVETLRDARSVGRAALPSTVLGLLFHAAEHAQRHAGQIATMARVAASLEGSGRD